MNFFEQQERARRNSTRLVLLLCLAVVGLILTTVAASAAILTFLHAREIDPVSGVAPSLQWPSAELIVTIAVVVISVVVAGGLFKRLQLSGGGKAVAESLNGRLLHPATTDADERKILNVVEEMAIAAGTPVPPVYLLDDPAINAFAAGRTPQDAVIGITRGCIRQLSRDELQGVVAHEFSHIIHGDMRLNTQLIATLHGILLIGLIGYFLLRAAPFRRSSNRDNSVLIMLALGVTLVIIGFAGTFFGNLIKAAVSRQREFLADASAVQYTRNPGGIAGALKKIGASQHGSRLQAANAVEYSHMFFGQGVKTTLNSLLATHPPLDQRIRRIEPSWDGDYAKPTPAPTASPTAQPQDTPGFPGQFTVLATAAHVLAADAVPGGGSDARLDSQAAHAAIAAIGQPDMRHIAYARATLAALDPALKDAAHDTYAARALVYGMLLAPTPSERQRQIEQLRRHALPEVFDALHQLGDKPAQVPAHARLALIDLAMPALKQMSPAQADTFRLCLDKLVEDDSQVSLMEWALRRIVLHNLAASAPVQQADDLAAHHGDGALLLAALAYAGTTSATEADTAFRAAATELGLQVSSIPAREAVTAARLEHAVNQLDRLKPAAKHRLLHALAVAVEHDGTVSVAEAELLRAIADSLHCPLPPLLAPA